MFWYKMVGKIALRGQICYIQIYFSLARLANSCSSLNHDGPTRIYVRHETQADKFDSSVHRTNVCEGAH